ncbi:MAG: SusE domain-containing protein [Bacteroidota bacterium]
MKRLAYIALAGILIMASCNKAELGPVILDNPIAPTLTAPANGEAIVLTEATAKDTVTFAWTTADYGFAAGVTYTVQYDKAGNDFQTPVTLGLTTNDTLKVSVEDLNNRMIALEIADGVLTNIEFRVKSYLSDLVTDLYSPALTVGVNPYLVLVVYPQLQVPGAYQGWDPANNTTVIFSLKSDNKYEGYIYFPEAGNNFKYTVGPSWGENYGDDGADGTLEPNGANLVATDAGMYKLNVDLNNKTHTFALTNWGLIGSATPGGWDTDTNMDYNADTRLLTITIDLVVGDIKFRANDAWTLNYGDNGANGTCELDGANIAITDAGNYTITLDLKGPVYRYKIKKN